MKTIIRNKKVLGQLKKVIVMNYFKQWKQDADHPETDEIDEIREKMATKFMKKLYLEKSFNILLDFVNWKKQTSDDMLLAKKVSVLESYNERFYRFEIG